MNMNYDFRSLSPICRQMVGTNMPFVFFFFLRYYKLIPYDTGGQPL